MADTTSPARDDSGRRIRREADPRVRPPRASDGPLFASADPAVAGGTYRERARQWLAETPWALPLFVRISLEMLDAGHTRYGSKAVWEIMRYRRRHTGEPLNNNHTRWVAEAAEEREPRLRGFYTTKGERSGAAR